MIFYPIYNELMNKHPTFRHVVEKVWSKDVTDLGKCWKCRAKIPFVIPRRGYSNGSGSCPVCGAEFRMMSNFGLVTLFPPRLFDECTVELFDRVFTSITPDEAREVLQLIDEK